MDDERGAWGDHVMLTRSASPLPLTLPPLLQCRYGRRPIASFIAWVIGEMGGGALHQTKGPVPCIIMILIVVDTTTG